MDDWKAEFCNYYQENDCGYLTPCWIWLGTLEVEWYGVLQCNKKRMKAHRLSWILHKGPIPKGLCVLHKCDVPPCVNPEHLFAGTCQKNVEDMDNKGRRSIPFGERNGNAKMGDEIARRVRQLAKDGVDLKTIGQLSGLTPHYCARIIRRDIWKYA